MITKDEIRESLNKFQINDIQFDLNGFCNGKCWYCPVKYDSQPLRQNMPIKDVEKILDNIVEEKGKLLSPNFMHIYTAHYNEIVLYPYFEEYLKLLSERNINTMVLTNGMGLSQKVSDIIAKYERNISGINFNIPAIEKNEWSKQSGFPVEKHEQLLNNIDYLLKVLPERVKNKSISVGMNGINERSFYEIGGWIEKLPNFPDVANSTLSEQEKLFKEYFPDLQIYSNPSIVDRNNLLEKNQIYSLTKANEKYNKRTECIGCRNGSRSFKEGELTGRIYGWLHINSFGELFLCCQDYNQVTKFGNILESSIRDVWFSEEHVDLIYNELNFGMCTTCNFAQWK